MKTTVKMTAGSSITVANMDCGEVYFCVKTEAQMVSGALTMDQAAVLAMGIESALAILDVQRANYGEVAA